MEPNCEPSSTDLVSNKRTHFFLWHLPSIIFFIGFFTDFFYLRTILWTASLSVMGISCINNALKCGRIHCYFTGPLFLLGAVGSLICGIGLINFTNQWAVIGYSEIIGGALLTYVPEMIWGKYKNRAQN